MRQALIVAIWMALTVFQLNAQNKSLDKLIHNMVRMDVDFSKTPGLVIGIIDRDSTYIYGFGETERDNNQKPDGNTIFEIGSVSKVFTAGLLPLLEKENLLNPEASVSEYFPELAHLQYKNKAVSLKHLSTHSSGLPRLPHNLGDREEDANQPYALYTQADLLAFLNKYQLNNDVGQEYTYSHSGYALLGEILEKAGKAPYSDLLNKYLFEPINMQDTRMHLNTEQQERMAQGYSLVKAVPAWQFQSFESAFGLKSTANDLLKWLKVHLGDTHTELGEILAQNCEAQLDTKTPDIYVGTGWHIMRMHKRFPDIIVHSGMTNGHTAHISFVKETHTAVVVLGNSKKSLSELGLTILETINYNWNLKKMNRRHQ